MSKMDLHDRTFTYCMTDLRAARQFFVQYLPKDILNLIDLTTLTLQKDIHVDVKLRKSVTDMVYSVRMGESLAYLYLLIDHKSEAERLMPLQIMRYALAIMHDHARQYKTEELPLVYPLVFYHGKISPYPYARKLDELFVKEYQVIGRQYLLEPINVIDLGQIEDEDFREYTFSGLMSFVMKHRRSQDIALRLKTMQDALEELLALGEKDLFGVLLGYIFHTAGTQQYDKILEVLQTMNDKVGGVSMTIAQMLRKEGRQESKLLIAQRMLEEGIDAALVARVTGLSIEEIKNIQTNH